MNNIGLPKDFELSQEFIEAFDLIEGTNKNVYLTGDAGTGKSTFLRYLVENTQKKVVVLAPTGVAALNVGGQTFHSFFGLPPIFIQKSDIKKASHAKLSLINALDVVIIDEASMLRADLIDAVDYALRLNRDKMDIPFGGVQIVLIGDLHQLPPVIDKGLEEAMSQAYKSPYFFDANVFYEAEVVYVELIKQYRQTDTKLIELLGCIRNKKLSDDHLKILNQRVTSEEVDGNPVVLTMTNRDASYINGGKLSELKSPEYHFEATISGRFHGDSSYPAEAVLKLKKGAQVMLLRNDPEHRWVNGTMAVVDALSKDTVNIKVDGNIYSVPIYTWERVEYKYDRLEGTVEKEVIGTFQQYPLKLAWAITVHKSQGQTFDVIVIITGRGAFVHGQIYVGLSRCRTLDGIFLLNPIEHRDIIFDKRVDGFKNKFKKYVNLDKS